MPALVSFAGIGLAMAVATVELAFAWSRLATRRSSLLRRFRICRAEDSERVLGSNPTHVWASLSNVGQLTKIDEIPRPSNFSS
mmetsp:Transcript_876/g.1974  ORF Transcript_876/g.1974 Transcript_876/m.1974 type:complete len:83 (-) Transcript_876:83-331(-)